jgi:hypothetical protein
MTLVPSSNVASPSSYMEIWYANVPTGSTGTVEWTVGGYGSLAMTVYNLHGQSGGGAATPAAGGTVTYNTTQAEPEGPIAPTVPTGGVGIVYAGRTWLSRNDRHLGKHRQSFWRSHNRPSGRQYRWTDCIAHQRLGQRYHGSDKLRLLRFRRNYVQRGMGTLNIGALSAAA